MKIWIDIKNSHEPLFFNSIISATNEHDYQITCREFAEIVDLLNRYEMKHEVIGSRPEGSAIKRKFGFVFRVLQLLLRVKNYDISLNHLSLWSIIASRLNNKKSIVFNDNDIQNLLHTSYYQYIDYVISPKAIGKDYYADLGINPNSIYNFDGFKEDIYVAEYKIPRSKYTEVPFDKFVTIRPENLQALYYRNRIKSIVPELLKLFKKEEVNVLFLPRYNSDIEYIEGYSNIFVPPKALNGLDVCHHSMAIITGAGTFSREAACMGKTAVSFFAGRNLLSVDEEMIKRKWVFHSRDPRQIVDYVLSSGDKKITNIERSKKCRQDVIKILNKIFDKEKI